MGPQEEPDRKKLLAGIKPICAVDNRRPAGEDRTMAGSGHRGPRNPKGRLRENTAIRPAALARARIVEKKREEVSVC